MARRNKASGFCFGSPLRLAELRSPPLRAETETPSESTFLEEPADPSYRTIYRKNVTPTEKSGLYWSTFDFSQNELIDHDAADPDWAPTGDALVYCKSDRIYIFDIKSHSSRLLVAGRAPTWSPNGKWISYVSLDGNASRVTLDRIQAPWPLRRHRPISPIRWSPDGQYVAFAERLPTIYSLVDERSRLLICRLSDGAAISVRTFGKKSADVQLYRWILNADTFCQRCRRT